MIKLEKVTKEIKGIKVLADITYQFEEGTVYGVFGENGSGKTMLLRAIAGLIVPTEGEIFFDEKKLHEDISFPPDTGIVIEHMELLPNFTAHDNLKILGKVRNVAGEADIQDTLRRVGLDAYPDKKVKKYSLGMKQRLNIAQAIFEKQKLILLDEPTNALDEEGIRLTYELIQEEKRKGATIIIATHHKADLETICDRLIQMRAGKMRIG